MSIQAKLAALITAISFVQVHAAGFDDFQTPEFDATSLNPAIESETNWKNTLSYTNAADDNSDTIVNRLSWRLQWEGLQGENNYWVIDTKLRLFNKLDMQHDDEKSIDYDLNLNSLYLQKSFENNSLKAGFQTITLGFMDFINVSNVFTPQDFSEAFFTSPEDSRIGQPIIGMTWYHQKQQIDIYLNLAPAENRYPTNNLEQALKTLLGNSNFTLQDGLPDAFEEPELLLKFQSQNNKHEYQWIVGSLLQNDPTLEQRSFVPSVIFSAEYPRYTLVAAAYSFTHKNHQFKLEGSYKNSIRPVDTGGLKIDESTIAAGWEYNANDNYTLTVETSKLYRDLPIQTSLIDTELDQTIASLRKNFLNETLTANLFIGSINPGDIEVSSLSLSYTPVDDWLIELIFTHIKADNSQNSLFSSNTLLKASMYW